MKPGGLLGAALVNTQFSCVDRGPGSPLFSLKRDTVSRGLELVSEVSGGDQPLVLVVLGVAGNHVASLG